MKKYTLQNVRGIKWRNNYETKATTACFDRHSLLIEPRINAAGNRIRNSFNAFFDGNKIGTGSAANCRVHIGLFLLSIEEDHPVAADPRIAEIGDIIALLGHAHRRLFAMRADEKVACSAQRVATEMATLTIMQADLQKGGK